MRTQSANRLKALILILMAIFLFQKFVSGQLFYYIGPRFSWLTIVAAILLITLAQSYTVSSSSERGEHSPGGDEEPSHEDDHDDHQHHHERTSIWPLLLTSIPLILGVLVPAKPLDATAVSTRGVSTELTSAADVGEQALSIIPSQRNILDWVRAMSHDPSPDALTGQEADITGFVYRDIRFADDQFMVGRFTLSCCVADATAIGVIVRTPDAGQFENNSWVRIKGTFTAGVLDGEAMPVLVADEIQPVQSPEQPYLFP